jgi:hypothetical protein
MYSVLAHPFDSALGLTSLTAMQGHNKNTPRVEVEAQSLPPSQLDKLGDAKRLGIQGLLFIHELVVGYHVLEAPSPA